MTEQEAWVILNEARSVHPVFIRGSHRYVVRRNGRVDVWLAVGKSGKRWKSDSTVTGDTCWLPKEVRERASYEKNGGDR